MFQFNSVSRLEATDIPAIAIELVRPLAKRAGPAPPQQRPRLLLQHMKLFHTNFIQKRICDFRLP